MRSPAHRIPAHILAAGRRGARPGEIEELRRIADARRKSQPERVVDKERSVHERVPDQPISLERCCRDISARKLEYQRRVDNALAELHDESVEYRLRGIPVDLRERVIASVRRDFLVELREFLHVNPHLGSDESVRTKVGVGRQHEAPALVGPELWCTDPDARRREFRRRLQDALQDEYDSSLGYRVDGIPERVRASISDYVESTFIEELQAFEAGRQAR